MQAWTTLRRCADLLTCLTLLLLPLLLLMHGPAAGRAVESSLNLRPGHKTVTVQAVPRQLHFHTHSEHLLGGGLALGQQQHQRVAAQGVCSSTAYRQGLCSVLYYCIVLYCKRMY